ncbi:MAG: IS1595 family transposase, partial [bacterium]
MPINRVQFQKGLSLGEFMRRYGTEEQCIAALEQSRWPGGFVCPSCRDTRHSIFVRDGRRHFQCCRCRTQTTITAGTIFADTKLPLRLWFLAMYLLTQSKNNVSALELMRHLGVGYRAAWRLKQKLMAVMMIREERRVLKGRVEIDDAYLGGERPGTTGRGSENKIPFVIAVQTCEQGRPQYMSLAPLRFTNADLSRWAHRALAPDARIVSDGLHCFRAAGTEVAAHERIVVGSGRKAVEHSAFKAVNTVLGNLKTAINGTYHAFDFSKYGHRYLAEAAYRFNRRFDLAAMLVRLLRAAAVTAPWPEPRLRLAE